MGDDRVRATSAESANSELPPGYTRPPGTCICNCHLDQSECCEVCAPDDAVNDVDLDDENVQHRYFGVG